METNIKRPIRLIGLTRKLYRYREPLLIGSMLLTLLALVSPIYSATGMPIFGRPKDAAQQMQCMNNMKKISQAVQLFASYNGEKLPGLKSNYIGTTAYRYWMDLLRPYVNSDSVFACPCDKTVRSKGFTLVNNLTTLSGRTSYAMRDVYKVPEYLNITTMIPGSAITSHYQAQSIAIIRCTRAQPNISNPDQSTMQQAEACCYYNYATPYNSYLSMTTMWGIAASLQKSIIPSYDREPNTNYKADMLHGEGVNYIYLDGHVGWMSSEQIIKDTYEQRRGQRIDGSMAYPRSFKSVTKVRPL
jgi:prepilin-type processing-associated H-X9-DG protein